MSHQHDHGHSHGHSHGEHANETRLFWCMLLIGSFMIVELIGGLLSGSLALLADAGHMLSDFIALMLAWLAFRIARKPADHKRSYGYERFQVLAAFVNGLSLLFIALWIVIEAMRRLIDPVEIQATPMLVVAIIGLLVNIAAFVILEAGHSDNLNMRGAAAHVLADLLGSVAAIVAALVIHWTGWMGIDPILSLVVAVLISRSGWQITRQSAHILLEGTPGDVSLNDVGHLVGALDGVADVHHVHVWGLNQEKRMATLHVVVSSGADTDAIRRQIETLLFDQFSIGHTTIQLERAHCADGSTSEIPCLRTQGCDDEHSHA